MKKKKKIGNNSNSLAGEGGGRNSTSFEMLCRWNMSLNL